MIPKQAYDLISKYRKSLGVEQEFGVKQLDDWNGMKVYQSYRLPGMPVIEACYGYPPYVLFDGTDYRLSTLQELRAIHQREVDLRASR